MEKTIVSEEQKNKGLQWLILVVVVGLVLAALWWFNLIPGTQVSSTSYQAVFLTNNQVYFGRLSNANGQYPVLRDIYYLQVTQTLQPTDPKAPPQPNLNLVKLGNELHGPNDEMVINRDHILFYEDLKSSSAVVKAIDQFKGKK